MLIQRAANQASYGGDFKRAEAIIEGLSNEGYRLSLGRGCAKDLSRNAMTKPGALLTRKILIRPKRSQPSFPIGAGWPIGTQPRWSVVAQR